MYHVSLKLTFKKDRKRKQPTAEEFEEHLKKYFGDDDKYLLVDYNNKNLMKNIVLDGTKMTFDVPKSIVDSLSQIVSNDALKKHISDYSHLGDTVYGNGDNFFEIRLQDENDEDYAIQIYPTSIVVK
jgi:hypothetical protein